MTHANVGSLLVFDPSKLHLVCTSKDRCTNTSKDAVVGIITERGEPAASAALPRGRPAPACGSPRAEIGLRSKRGAPEAPLASPPAEPGSTLL